MDVFGKHQYISISALRTIYAAIQTDKSIIWLDRTFVIVGLKIVLPKVI
jgi:hypothetical protein